MCIENIIMAGSNRSWNSLKLFHVDVYNSKNNEQNMQYVHRETYNILQCALLFASREIWCTGSNVNHLTLMCKSDDERIRLDSCSIFDD